MPALRAVVDAVHVVYDPRSAESWDAVGLVAGDPDEPVDRVLLAVDPELAVVDEALAWGAQLLLTHHPLYLRGTATVAADSAKGRVVHRLLRAGCGLLVAHTNADVAPARGVSDALATRLGLLDAEPLRSAPAPLDQVVVFVPPDAEQRLVDALASAGAGALGAYERCAFSTPGEGTFTPLPGATPAVGEPGRREVVQERRVEMVLPRARRAAVVRALRAVHPYEEPAFSVYEIAATGGRAGLGRVGTLGEPVPLRALARRVALALPATAWGVRAAGDPDRPVRRLAVCGGSGGELAGDAARAGADALLTADLRHHTAGEAVADTGVALLDAAHWATEQPWLATAAGVLREAFGDDLHCRVSGVRTDPWTVHEPGEETA